MGSNDDTALTATLHALSGSRYPISRAAAFLPDKPGLYAIHAHAEVWTVLGLDQRSVEVPLYVGKAEDSLVTRDLKTHFSIDPEAAPKTGSSTVRRSFAALLRGSLNLRGVPRNKLKPDYFYNFGLEPEADLRLTDWMQSHLLLACWPKPAGVRPLADVEKQVLKQWDPPINLKNSPTKLPRLVAARAIMTAEARTWAQEHAARPEQ
jgi:hypothetical protein